MSILLINSRRSACTHCVCFPIRDVVTALKRHEPGLALRISGNLCSNALSTARMRLHRGIPLSSRAREGVMSRVVGLARAITLTTGIGLQLVALYAALATFGGLITLGLYGVGVVTVVLQQVVLRRAASCSAGD